MTTHTCHLESDYMATFKLFLWCAVIGGFLGTQLLYGWMFYYLYGDTYDHGQSESSTALLRSMACGCIVGLLFAAVRTYRKWS